MASTIDSDYPNYPDNRPELFSLVFEGWQVRGPVKSLPIINLILFAVVCFFLGQVNARHTETFRSDVEALNYYRTKINEIESRYE